MSATPAVALSEAEWQEQFIQLAHALGWEHNFTRRTIGRGGRWTTATSKKGWPDLTLWNERQRRTMYVELKTETGRLSPEQEACLRSLTAAGNEVHVWRPSDLDEAHRALRPRRAAPNIQIHFESPKDCHCPCHRR
jgi:hypothetical protein